MTTLDGRTPDIAAENIEQLKKIFPDVFEEGKVNFDKLRQDLGEYVDDEKEQYDFTWNGKGRARRLSQTPSMGTLRPCETESKNWDDTQNLYIEGDNLEVLKLLQKSYHGKIKMIYIDPPYNTGGDFVYPDDFSDSIENYKKLTGQVDGEGRKISTNSEANGRYHTDWLNMMYPRLRLARNLLTEDGVIFVSIDENEIVNLRELCNEIFGEENFIAQITLLCNPKGRSQDMYIANCHEYILIFAKTSRPKGSLSIPKDCNDIAADYTLQDRNGAYRELELRNTHRDFGKFNRPNLYYPFFVSGSGEVSLNHDSNFDEAVFPIWGDGFEGCWTWGKQKASENIELLSAKKIDNIWKIYRKAYAVQDGEEVKKQVKSIWTDSDYFTEKGQKAANDLFDTKEKLFQSPKSPEMIKQTIRMGQVQNNDIVLDFFSGSATTAYSVMQLNAEDGGNRKFIMVQLPEPCAEGTEAAKAGYKNICEIGKERIRRVGEKIKAEVEEQNAQMKIGEEPKPVPDVGFKVFKLDSSNLRKWQPDYENLERSLDDIVKNYVDGRSELDVVYEIMLKMGLDLTWPLDKHSIGGKNVYVIGMGALMICLDDNITTDIADGMAALYKDLAPGTWKVVFKDNSFATDSVKVNIKEILKCAGLDEDAFTTV